MKELMFQKELTLINQINQKNVRFVIIALKLLVIDLSHMSVINVMIYLSMMAYELKDTAILNVKGIDYRCVLWNTTRNDAINRLNNFKLDDKSTLYVWILVQIKLLMRYLLWC